MTKNSNTKSENPEQAMIAAKEAALVAKYGDKIVQGTVRRAPEGSKYNQKLLVQIRTRGLDGEYDGNTREVATSDVFQVHHTDEVAREVRKQRAKEKRAQAKAAKDSEPKTKAKTTKAKTTKSRPKTKAKEAATALDV